jgi:hypothetical protein
VKRLKGSERDDLLLVKLEPPLIGQKYGLGGGDINLVLVATRHQGASLFPITEWPVFVHVARPLISDAELREREAVRDDEYESIAWAELYSTESDARTKAM